MEDKDHDLFCTDLINLANVLPHVTLRELCGVLKDLRKKKDRVQIILKQYLFFNERPNFSRNVSLSEDITKIKSVLPDYSASYILKFLNEAKAEKNRVQMVLRKYWEDEYIQAKRSFEGSSDCAIPEKKRKLYSDPTETGLYNNSGSDIEEIDSVEDLQDNINSNNNIDFATNNFNAQHDTIAPTNHLQNAVLLNVARLTNLTQDCVMMLEENASNLNMSYSQSHINELYEDDDASSSDNFDVFDLHESHIADSPKKAPIHLQNIELIKVENEKVAPDVEIISDTMFELPSTSYLNIPSTSSSLYHPSTSSTLNPPTTSYLDYPSTSSSHQYHNIVPTSSILDYQPKPSTSTTYRPKLELPTKKHKQGCPKTLTTKTSSSSCNIVELLSYTNTLKKQMAQIDAGLQSISAEHEIQEEPLTIKRNVSATIVKNPATYPRNNLSATIVRNDWPTSIVRNNVDGKDVIECLSIPHVERNVTPIPIIDLSETLRPMTRNEEEFFDNNLQTRMNGIIKRNIIPINVTGAIPRNNIPVRMVRHNLPAANITPTVIDPAQYLNRMTSTPLRTYDWARVHGHVMPPIKVRNDLITPAQNTLPATYVKHEIATNIMRNDIIVPTPPAVENNFVLMPVKQEVPPSKEPSVSSTLQEHPYYFKLMEMFPDISPNYLRKLCHNQPESGTTFEYLISVLLTGKYPLRVRTVSPEPEVDFDEQYKLLLDLFPDADPTYLQHQCERLLDKPENFKKFVATNLETKNYPSKEEYLRKLKLSAQEKQYTTEFNVKKFLEIIPNPNEYFTKPPTKSTLNANFNDCNYALIFLKNHYPNVQIYKISQVFRKHNFSVIKTAEILDNCPCTMKHKRKLYPISSCSNIPLLQEIAYVAHKQEINKYIELQNYEKQQNRKHAKEAGLFKACGCCFDEEIMPDEIVCCEGGHEFCMECVKKGCEVLIGQQKLQFPCLLDCGKQFNLHVLQMVLAPKVFSKLIQRITLEEIMAAGIKELESCPFCDFATILAPGDKVFRCLNNDCMKESCRLCKELSHIPLRCEEVEREKDVEMRTYIEDKMTQALIRKCYKCGLKFVKADGCNKMTCSCGAKMCYICQQPVTDYSHFNGQGGEQFHLCPLYSDTNKLHIESVKLGAETAKKELGLHAADKKLKNDPAKNLEQHF